MKHSIVNKVVESSKDVKEPDWTEQCSSSAHLKFFGFECELELCLKRKFITQRLIHVRFDMIYIIQILLMKTLELVIKVIWT